MRNSLGLIQETFRFSHGFSAGNRSNNGPWRITAPFKRNIMSLFRRFTILITLLVAIPSAYSAVITVESHFYQGGFSGGGSISGFFRGKDLDGDGQLYAASPFLSSILDIPVGNELEYAELTFNNLGTSLGAQTLVYDKNVADIFDFSNFFFGFAYNIGSASFGDEANEGFSFSPFAPSTNYLLGEAFIDLFIGSIAEEDRASFGSCNGINNCGAVLEIVPDSTGVDGIRTVSQNLSSSAVSVSSPNSLALIALFFLWCISASILPLNIRAF